MSTLCLTCCKSCYKASRRSKKSRLNLLLIGSVQFIVKPQTPWCDHEHTHDGCHSFQASSFSPLSISETLKQFFTQIDHLITEGYIQATYRCIKVGEIFVRIYVDLDKIQGERFNGPPPRDPRRPKALPYQESSKDARRNLGKILPTLTNNHKIWNTVESTDLSSP